MNEKVNQQVRQAIGDHDVAHPYWKEERREREIREAREVEARAGGARWPGVKPSSNWQRTTRRRGAIGSICLGRLYHGVSAHSDPEQEGFSVHEPCNHHTLSG